MEKWNDLHHKRKQIRLENFDYANSEYIYFVTICSKHLEEPFKNEKLSELIVNSLFHLRKNGKIYLYCYCLMPDHLHCAVTPLKKQNLSKIIGAFKSYTTRKSWEFGIKDKLWERSFYDHIVRSDESLFQICEYILNNPVRKELVKNSEQWKYLGLLDPLPI